MTSIEKVQAAEQQVIAVANGRADHIDCPFCGEVNTRQQMLVCCTPLADLIDAVMDRIEAGEAVTQAREIVDRARHLADRQRQNMIVLN